MHDHVENKFDQFEILNETFSLSEINWKTLINHALTRFKETESIKLVINSNQHPFQSTNSHYRIKCPSSIPQFI